MVTIALSCIRTIDAEHMPFLLRFLLLSATQVNVRRIISQIREHLRFVGMPDPRAARNKKLKGKSLAGNADASILEALRSSLRFKNVSFILIVSSIIFFLQLNFFFLTVESLLNWKCHRVLSHRYYARQS